MKSSAKSGADLVAAAINNAKPFATKTAANDQSAKPRLLVDGANPDTTVSALRDVLTREGDLYDRGVPVRLYNDAIQGTKRVQQLRSDDLVLQAHQICRPYRAKTDRNGKNFEEDTRLPKYIAEMYLVWHGHWRLPSLNGIALSPLLRDDGSFHSVTGYDRPSGLWCEAVPDLRHAVPTHTTREQAEAALLLLRQTFRTFCFADAIMCIDPETSVEVVDTREPPGMDESSFLVALLTAICRVSLPLTPGVVVRAASLSGAGAGKGLLVRCMALIAFGREPHAVSGGSGREELEKRIAAELMEAGPMVFLDNLNNRTFKSDLLASVITERPARVRVLGRSQMVPLNSSALVAMTGNGLVLSEDLARRFLVIELDPRTEDPEARDFKSDIKSICRDRRDELLAAALTIWRWGRQSDDTVRGIPLGSFDQWSSWVRDPLLTLCCKDPVARVSETKARDVERQEINEIFGTWRAHHGDKPVALRDLAEPVREALNPLNRPRQYLAKRLETLSGTRVAGLVLVRQAPAGKSGVAVYALQSSGNPETHRRHRGHPPDHLPEDGRTEAYGLDDPDATRPQKRKTDTVALDLSDEPAEEAAVTAHSMPATTRWEKRICLR